MIPFFMRSRNLETAVHREIRFVESSAFYGYIRESWYYRMDQSKLEIYFHNLLGIIWHLQTGAYAVTSGQLLIDRKVSAGQVIKAVVAVVEDALWLFLNGVYEPTDSDIDVGNDNKIFSSDLN